MDAESEMSSVIEPQRLFQAPIYTPSPAEFSDPLKYIQHITPTASKYGICKIRPPAGWKPPFCANSATFTFTPRVQHLSDVSAHSRVRNSFITALINFWEAQNITLYSQLIKGKHIDLFRLWKGVQSLGGFETVCEQRLWSTICQQLGFNGQSQYAAALCTKYKKNLLPYEKFLEQQKVGNSPKPTTQQQSKSITSRRKKLPIMKMLCTICGLGDNDECLLLCDGCESIGACHTYCLRPPLSDVPKGTWFCPKCISQRFSKLQNTETFGFKQAKKSRTLGQFGIFADEFKAKHFGKSAHVVSLNEVEEEFWRILGTENTEVVVEYGADLSARDFGSGFPSKHNNTLSRSKAYANSPWNLNNISIGEHSALRFLPTDISGMIVPWCYVGMVFSCFCWHTEDHWSYSINYLHKGSAKTWYGVPTASADAFEAAMREEVPELFENTPDLLHHMTTMLSPHTLLDRGVPVYRMDQLVGEFIITFPRAYHAGFNQGFNFAEAVNFCPPEWFEMGQCSIDNYAIYHRSPVFSHAELLCRMASLESELLSVDFLRIVTKQMGQLLTTERSLRRHLARLGVRRTERMAFEESEDEKRECTLCCTTLYLSALACRCSTSMVCLAHHQVRTCCAREEQFLRYRYGLDELSDSFAKLTGQLDEYTNWQSRVQLAARLSGIAPPDLKPELPVIDCASDENQKDVKMEKLEPATGLTGSDEVTNIEALINSASEPAKLEENHSSSEDQEHADVSMSYKPEELVCPTVIELNELIDVGKMHNYPQSDLNTLHRVIEAISDCSAATDDLVSQYRLACNSISGSSNASFLDQPRASVSTKQDEDVDSGCSSTKSADTSSVSEEETSDTTVEQDEDSASQGSEDGDGKEPVAQPPSCSPSRAQPEQLAQPGSRSSPRKATIARRLTSTPMTSRVKGPVVTKLSRNEFISLVHIVSKFAPFLPDRWEQLSQLDRHLTSWQKRAGLILARANEPDMEILTPDAVGAVATAQSDSDNLLTVNGIEEMVSFAEKIGIDLPEKIPLERVLERLRWHDLVDSTLHFGSINKGAPRVADGDDKPSLSYLCDLQLRGDVLLSSVAYLETRPITRQRKAITRKKGGEEVTMRSPVPQTKLDAMLVACSGRLLEVIHSAEAVETRLVRIKNSGPGTMSLSEVLEELQQASTLPVWLPIVSEMRERCDQAHGIATKLNAIERLLVSTPFSHVMQPLDPRTFPDSLYDQLSLGTVSCTTGTWTTCVQSLRETVDELSISCPQLDRVCGLIDLVDQFRDRVARLFLWPHTKLSLLEVLLPRSARSLELLVNLDMSKDPEQRPWIHATTGSNIANSTSSTVAAAEAAAAATASSGRRSARSSTFSLPAYANCCQDNAHKFAKSLTACEDAGQLYDAVYGRFIGTELDFLRRLRDSNMFKSKCKNQQSITYCICRKPGFSGFMVQCELCRDWFHGRCILLPNMKESETDRLRYVCPRCQRSQRPDLEKVMTLLNELVQKLPVDTSADVEAVGSRSNRSLLCLFQLPEFAAAQMLCKRAFAFIRRMYTAIQSNSELAQAVSKYEHFSGCKMSMQDYNELPEPCATDQPPMTELAARSSHYPVKTYQRSSSGHSDAGGYHRIGQPVARMPIPVDRHAPSAGIGSACELESVLVTMDRRQPRKSSLLLRDELARGLPIDVTAEQKTEAAEALASFGLSTSSMPRTNSASRITDAACELRTQLSASNSLTHSKSTTSHGSGYIPVRGSGGEGSSQDGRLDSTNTAGMDSGGGGSYRHARQTSDTGIAPSAAPKPGARPHPPRTPTRSFCHFTLSTDTRQLLETLIMEASLLEVSLPQTRWLWQLHLATDPEANGAVGPWVARAEEQKFKRRFLRQLDRVPGGSRRIAPASGGGGGTAKRRSMKSNEDDDASVQEADAVSVQSEVSSKTSSDGESTQPPEKRPPRQGSSVRSQTISSRASTSGGQRRPYTARRKPFSPHPMGSSGAVANRNDPYRARRRPTNTYRQLVRTAPTAANSSRMPGAPRGPPQLNPRAYQRRMLNPMKKFPHHPGSNRGSLIGARGHRMTPSVRGIRRRAMRSPDTEYPLPQDWEPMNFEPDDYYSPASEDRYSYDDDGEGMEPERDRIHTMPDPRGRMRRDPSSELHPFPTVQSKRRGQGRMGPGDWSNRPIAIVAGSSQPRRRGKGAASSASEGEREGEEEENEGCAANPCRNPRTGTVKWIACDCCGDWFHQLCVGIHHKAQVPKEYMCSNCQKRASKQLHQQQHHDHHQRPSGSLPQRQRRISINKPIPSSSRLTLGRKLTDRRKLHPNSLHVPSRYGSCTAQRPVGWNAGARSSMLASMSNAGVTRGSPGSDLIESLGSEDVDEEEEEEEELVVEDAQRHSMPLFPLQPTSTDGSSSSGGVGGVDASTVVMPTTADLYHHHIEVGQARGSDPYESLVTHDPTTHTMDTRDPTELLLQAIDVVSGSVANLNPDSGP